MQNQSDAIHRLVNSAGWARVLLPQRRLHRLYAFLRESRGDSVFESLLQALEVSYAVRQRDIELIPKSGAAIVIANHPYGMLDGLLMGALLLRIRRDVKIVANRLLDNIPELAPHCIYVDVMADAEGPSANARGLRSVIRHLQSGGLVVFFPAGEVAHWSLRKLSISDPDWNDSAARLSQMTGAPVVPICIHGTNSFSFHVSGLIHPKLRTLQLPYELLNKQGQRVVIAVGPEIKAETLKAMSSPETATSMLRWNTDVLSLRESPSRPRWHLRMLRPVRSIAGEADVNAITRELLALPAEARLQSQGEFDIYALSARQAPTVVREIGRLREISFRQIGEGTGKSLDLDRFDDHYTHLVLWHRGERQVAGGYRLGNMREILHHFGPSGLYTSTLFRYHSSFFFEIPEALELGRSFVRPEYQKHYLPLLLLWKGIGAYLVAEAKTPVLFGAVSISSLYSPASREVIAAFLRARMAPERLVAKVAPHSPFRRVPECSFAHGEDLARALTLNDACERVAGWEPDGKDVPILVKHYVKLGGRTLAFSVDPKFSNVLDALIMVDLRNSDRAMLSRYLGKAEAQAFLNQIRERRIP